MNNDTYLADLVANARDRVAEAARVKEYIPAALITALSDALAIAIRPTTGEEREALACAIRAKAWERNEPDYWEIADAVIAHGWVAQIVATP